MKWCSSWKLILEFWLWQRTTIALLMIRTILFLALLLNKTMTTLKRDSLLEWIINLWIHAIVTRLFTHQDIWAAKWTMGLENMKFRWEGLTNIMEVMLLTILWHASAFIVELGAVNITMKSPFVLILGILNIFTLITGSAQITTPVTHTSTNLRETSTSAEISTLMDSYGKTIPVSNSL